MGTPTFLSEALLLYIHVQQLQHCLQYIIQIVTKLTSLLANSGFAQCTILIRPFLLVHLCFNYNCY